MQRQWLISNACLQLPVVDACAAILIWVTPNQHFKSTLLGRGSQKRVRCENDNNSGRPLRLKKRTSIISIVTAGRLAHFSNVYSLRTIIIITRLPGHYPASSKSQNTSGSRLTNDGRSRITHKKQALPCSHESAESLSQWVSESGDPACQLCLFTIFEMFCLVYLIHIMHMHQRSQVPTLHLHTRYFAQFKE